MRYKVSVVKYNNERTDVRKALELCGAMDKLTRLSPSHRVLLKPNLVMWDEMFAFPKYGVVTTALVMEEMVRILAEHGITNITIGEASSEDKSRGTGTLLAYQGLGYHKLQKRYGVRLADFNRGPFTAVEFDGFTLNFATEALETDFLINMPVLKTHSATKVSLGFKNLKGCLAKKSKMRCHHVDRPLDNFVSWLGEKIWPDITLIDGIYTLERGPAINGTARRADVIIASTDMFAADVAGSMAMGFAAEEIGHLRDFAIRHQLPLDGSDIEFTGDALQSVAMKLRWDWPWEDDNSGPPAFRRQGIEGIYYPKYDETICSTCSFYNNLILVLLISAYSGTPFGNIEFLSGKQRLSEGGYDKTFLFGKCIAQANKHNPNIRQAVEIRGCPPTLDEIIRVLNENGIPARLEHYRAYRQSLADRYSNQPEFSEDVYRVSD